MCPTCTVTLRDEYGLNVKHALVAVAERLGDLDLRPLSMRVTYHDPCHLGRMLGVTEEPRHPPGPGRRAGRDGAQPHFLHLLRGRGRRVAPWTTQPRIEIAKSRVRDALQVGVETIVTVCPTCGPTLLRAAGRLANEVDVFVDVLDLWALLDESLGGYATSEPR